MYQVATFLVLILLAAPASADKVYKWVDDQGQVHYSAQPPAQDQFTEMKIRSTSPAAVESEPEEAEDGEQTADEVAFETPKELAQREALDRKLRAENCRIAKRNKSVVENARRVMVNDGKGGKRRLDDGERTERLQKADQNITKFCR